MQAELKEYLVYKCDRIGENYEAHKVEAIFKKMDENNDGIVTL